MNVDSDVVYMFGCPEVVVRFVRIGRNLLVVKIIACFPAICDHNRWFGSPVTRFSLESFHCVVSYEGIVNFPLGLNGSSALVFNLLSLTCLQARLSRPLSLSVLK